MTGLMKDGLEYLRQIHGALNDGPVQTDTICERFQEWINHHPLMPHHFSGCYSLEWEYFQGWQTRRQTEEEEKEEEEAS